MTVNSGLIITSNICFMTVKQNQVTQTNNSSLVSQIPLISQSGKILIDARLMHQRLGSKQQFSNWIKNRIKDYNFQEKEDYLINLFNRSDGKPGKRKKDYFLTLDMAKELAMLERSEVGRDIRRYFIDQEKKARGMVSVPSSDHLFTDLIPKVINNRKLYPYKEILRRCGYSLKSSSASRKARYWMHFIKEGNLLYITEEFSLHLLHTKTVYNNRKTLVTKSPVLALGWGENDTLTLNF